MARSSQMTTQSTRSLLNKILTDARLQLIGLLVVAVPLVYGVTVLTNKAEAFDGRLSDTEKGYLLLNQKVDIMLQYWGLPIPKEPKV